MKASSALLKRVIPVERRSIPVRDVVKFSCPLPPPLNGLYTNVAGKGRIKSRRYREWIKEAGWALQAARPGRIEGPVNIEIIVPAKTAADRDSPQKALLDLIVRHGIIADDRSDIVRDLHILPRDLIPAPAVPSATVTITRVPGRVA